LSLLCLLLLFFRSPLFPKARELDLRKRAERLMNRNSGLESLESSSDSEDDEDESEIDETRVGFLPASNTPGESSSSFNALPKQRLNNRPSALALPKIKSGDGQDKPPPRRLNRKTVMKSLLPNNNRVRPREQNSQQSTFSFLSQDVWDEG